MRGIAPGDRVAIAGGGFANHAEVDVVPSLLCARVPDGVAAEDAAFATLGAIAMNGFRRAEAQVGSTVAVIGLGLIGQLAVRIARAAGCRVLGVDLDARLLELAAEAGRRGGACARELDARVPLGRRAPTRCWSAPRRRVATIRSRWPPGSPATARRWSSSATCRWTLPRPPFYDKELDLRLSRSYGPGRYDPDYELHGLDYPIGYVRWTEQRNMEAFLELVAERQGRPVASWSPTASRSPTPSGPSSCSRSGDERAGRRSCSSTRPSAAERAAAASLRDGQAPPSGRAAGAARHDPALRPDRRRLLRHRDAHPRAARGRVRARRDRLRLGLSAESARRRFGFESAHCRARRGDRARRRRPGRDRDPPRLPRRARRRGAAGGQRRLRREAAGARRRGAGRGPRRPGRDAARRCSSASTAATRRSRPSCASSPGPRLMAYRVNAGRCRPTTGRTTSRAAAAGCRARAATSSTSSATRRAATRSSVSARGLPSRARTCRWRRPTTSASRSPSPTAASARVHYAADAPTRPGQGALRDQRARRLRGDRRLPQRRDLAAAANAPARRRRQDKGFAPPVRDARRACSRARPSPPDPESF